MTKNMIIEELTNRGYVVSEQTCIKNGIEKTGLIIKKNTGDCIAPTIYPDDLIKDAKKRNMEFSEVIDSIISMISQEFTVDVDKLTSPDYIVSHVRIGVQKAGTEELVKRESPFDGIEEYLYISDSSNGQGFSVKLKPQMLELAGLKAKGLFEIAETNNHAEFKAEPLFDIVSKIIGEDACTDFEETAPMYVITNNSNMRGASAMLDKKGIGELADRIGIHEFVLLPSSIHECILVPKTGDVDMEMFENMVKEVNATTLDPFDILVDRVYLLTA
ncbi:MAG: hypothetical protein J5965_28685 [Aeriscardovia sp.]|nr:hypothetical protein [Aeriscardovia sp.]